MIGIIIIIILFIASIGGNYYFQKFLDDECKPKVKREFNESDSEYDARKAEADKEHKALKKKAKWGAVGLFVLVSLIVLGFNTVRIVPTGEVGVKTAFGVVSGRANEGINFIAPWENIIPMNIKIQKRSFEDLSASTKDAQMITNIDIDVNYSLNPEKAEEVYSRVGESYHDTLMAPLLTQFIKDRLALYNAESLVTERNKIVDDITEQLQNNLADYGINVEAVSLVNYDFSADFSSALERKAVAAKEIETAKNNQEKAKVEAETNRIKSQQLTEPVLMEKLIDAIRNGNGTYIINTDDLSIGIK